MNKILKYTVMIFTATLFMMSCEKHEIGFDTVSNTNMAFVQLHNQLPVPVGTEYNFYKVELNGLDLSRNGGTPPVNVPLNSWNSLPTALGRYYETATGQASIKLYQSTNHVLKYDQSVALQAGKQGLILYDFDKPPLSFMEVDNFINDRAPYFTDTVTFIRFFNLMQESAGVASNLKLQYQYQYLINPLYTETDALQGKIPAGYKIGDAVPEANRVRSPWINLGGPVGFGEDTGFQIVPVKRVTWVSQGDARIDYRVVVAQGGVEGVTMTAGDHLLICRDGRSAASVTASGFTDWWTGYVGRYAYHFFGGYRDDIPGMAIVQYFQR